MARISKSTVTKKTTSSDLPNLSSLSRRRAQRPKAPALAPKRQPAKRLSYRSKQSVTGG